MIEHIQKTYQAINAQTLKAGILSELYTDDVVFIDPIHRISGLAQLERYFTALYRNVKTVHFEYGHCGSDQKNELFMEWEMTMEHPRLNGGAPVIVNGLTLFSVRDGKVYQHRDYFDTAQMLFEHLPILGRVIRFIKHRLGQ
ncbi:MAG: nuclear transport factor 2 family protein [Natronospirillum sp.]